MSEARACRAIRSLTEPISQRSIAPRPRDPTTTRSACIDSASSSNPSAGDPSLHLGSARKPAFLKYRARFLGMLASSRGELSLRFFRERGACGRDACPAGERGIRNWSDTEDGDLARCRIEEVAHRPEREGRVS